MLGDLLQERRRAGVEIPSTGGGVQLEEGRAGQLLEALEALVERLEATRQLVDSEVRRVIDECYVRALAVLRENRPRLISLTKVLLEQETLEAGEAYDAAGLSDALERGPDLEHAS